MKNLSVLGSGFETWYVDLLENGNRMTKILMLKDDALGIFEMGSPFAEELGLDFSQIKYILHKHEKSNQGWIHIIPSFGREDIKIFVTNKFDVLHAFRKFSIHVKSVF